jgi:uncharacterized membrane protein YesL
MSGPAVAARRVRDGAYTLLDVVTVQILLSLLWLVASVGVITMPAATVALLVVIRRRRTGDDPPPVRDFCRTFLRELRRSLLAGLIWVAVGLVLVVDLLIVGRMADGRQLVLVLLGSLLLLYLWASVNVAPVYARIGGGWRAALRGAIVASAARPVPAVLAILLLGAAALTVWILPPLIMIVPAVLARMIIELADGRRPARIDQG